MTVTDRFLNYVKIDSQSSEKGGSTPSTAGQFSIAERIAEDLKKIGVADVVLDDKCYIYANIPPTPGREKDPKVGLIAHMDTAPAFCGTNIKPRIIKHYDGEDIILNEKLNIVLRTAEFPEITKYRGQSIIVTDGTTLLGADDKAGIAEIVSAIENIFKNNISHPAITVAFTPDEEIGAGVDNFDVDRMRTDYTYTVDGGELGELQYENFNAASATITVNGNCIHPGEGKNRMKNAILMAMEFNSMLPPAQIPAHTEGREGFFHLTDIEGNEERTVMHYIVRDHSKEIFSERKNMMLKIADYLNSKYGENTINAEIKDSYYNMYEKVKDHMEIVERAERAFEKNGIDVIDSPIRGGTDGARLSFMGIVCPNLSAGGHNFHGKYEYIPIESMEAMVNVLVDIIQG